MGKSPEFSDRLDREIKNYIQDTIDGCSDCQERINRLGEQDKNGVRTTCEECGEHILDVTINPKKYIRIK